MDGRTGHSLGVKHLLIAGLLRALVYLVPDTGGLRVYLTPAVMRTATGTVKKVFRAAAYRAITAGLTYNAVSAADTALPVKSGL
jgi:hypothetical protein